MSQVVTELVIDANTSGADQFSQAMDRAGASAKGSVASAASLTLAVAGVGLSFIATLVALRGFYDYVGGVNKQLMDIADNAAAAGMSTTEFQQTLFAARAAGLTEKDFVSGLDKIGADLTAAGRGVTDFGKLFEANGVSIKQANGELITTKTAINDLAKLMENATPAVQRGIASIVGISKEWIPFLKQGVDGIEAQKKAALDLGVIIDDDMIKKSKEFDSQWKTAIATWDLQFKASLASILPIMVQLANLANTIITGVAAVGSSVSRWTTPDDQKSKAQLNDQINQVAQLRDMMDSLSASSGVFQKQRVMNLKELLGLPDDAEIKQVDALLEKLQAMYDRPEAKRIEITGGTTVLPKTGTDSSALDIEIARLEKHIAVTKADTEAVGETTAAQAGLRAEATLYAAAEKAGKTDLEQYADQFMKIRERVEEATLALDKAKIASEIKFGKNTAFLSTDDVAIATQLKGIYPDVATALGSVEAAGLRTNAALRGISTTIESTLATGLTDIAMGTKTAGKSFQDMSLIIIRAIEEMVIKLLIITPLMKSLQGMMGGGLVPGVGVTSAVAGSGAGMMGGIPFPMFAEGTASAPGGWSIVGESGPELMKVPTGAQILASGTPPPSNDNSGGNVTIGDIHVAVPEGTTPENASAIGNAVRTSMIQVIDERLSYHTRSRGMLNRAA